MNMIIHWSGEARSGEFRDITDDKSQVTCADCLFIIDVLDQANRRTEDEA